MNPPPEPPPRRFLEAVERRLPASLVEHPLRWSWAWFVLLASATILGWVADWPIPVWVAVVVVGSLPSLTATVALLLRTPRSHLDEHDSVFGHFFVRFVTLVVGFAAWTISVVMSASLSTLLQLMAENREDEITYSGIQLFAGLMLPVVLAIWLVFLLRCAWFLAKLRGWREHPSLKRSRVPGTFLAEFPRLRHVVVGFAHPGALLASAGLSSAAVLTEETLRLTFTMFF
ncbi:hypothetical protein [Pseudoclavibacter sp. VKM Ac-2867]|uniref:hypothetical protein n=1 Tax=Pseudoclavibacter sp. VKM Ac-2867 TaxID=2783829 RepID=UPI00188C293C|nr:hypothetical protein [Pseudoclavibacter sp. VKM Ac-2867]MBF4457407.1 hypothetical protein [Pseudoclavibacter sp. VKM Ac-2867]